MNPIAIVLAFALLATAALIAMLTNWIPKPSWLPTTAVMAVLPALILLPVGLGWLAPRPAEEVRARR